MFVRLFICLLLLEDGYIYLNEITTDAEINQLHYIYIYICSNSFPRWIFGYIYIYVSMCVCVRGLIPERETLLFIPQRRRFTYIRMGYIYIYIFPKETYIETSSHLISISISISSHLVLYYTTECIDWYWYWYGSRSSSREGFYQIPCKATRETRERCLVWI